MNTSWAPTPEQVKALLPQRLQGQAFSATTIPTADQVASLAEDICEEILAEVGDVPGRLHGMARRCATLGTAAQVELSTWPEQVNGNTTPGLLLQERYTQALGRLAAAIERQREATTGAEIATMRTPTPWSG